MISWISNRHFDALARSGVVRTRCKGTGNRRSTDAVMDAAAGGTESEPAFRIGRCGYRVSADRMINVLCPAARSDLRHAPFPHPVVQEALDPEVCATPAASFFRPRNHLAYMNALVPPDCRTNPSIIGQ